MLLAKDKAFVFKRYIYNEAGVKILAFTREHGLLELFHKTMKHWEAYGGQLDLLSLAELHFIDNPQQEANAVFYVESMEKFLNLYEDLNNIYMASFVVEIFLLLIPIREVQRELFDHFQDLFFSLDADKPEKSLRMTLFMAMNILKKSGHFLDFNRCVSCEASLQEEDSYMLQNREGFFCEACSRDKVIKSCITKELKNNIAFSPDISMEELLFWLEVINDAVELAADKKLSTKEYLVRLLGIARFKRSKV